MIDDTVVLFARWLSGAIDAAASVNTLLPLVTLRAGDPAPPQIKTVYNEVEDRWIIEGTDPDLTPSLVVGAGNADASLFSLGGQRGASHDSVQRPQSGIAGSPLVIGVSYMVRQTDLVPAVKSAGYTRAAIRRSIALLEQASQTNRTLNNTLFLATRQTTERRLLASKGNSALMGVVLAVVTVRDLAP
jgi:hypothetical protein